MIRLETARKLKDAGVKWEPQVLDFFTFCAEDIDGIEPYVVCVMQNQEGVDAASKLLKDKMDPADVVWLPHLDQLLAEGDIRGYEIFNGRNASSLWKGHKFIKIFENIDRSEAAAAALLWILEQEGQASDS